MVKKKSPNPRKKSSIEKPISSKAEKKNILKIVIFTIAIILIIYVLHSFFSNNVFNKINADEDKGVVQESDIEMSVDMILINGQRSPNLVIELNTKEPSRITVELYSDDFHDSAEDGYSTSHNLNLILPESLIGHDLEVRISSYDSLNRKSEYIKTYTIN